MRKLKTCIVTLCILIGTYIPAYAISTNTDLNSRILSIEENYFTSHNVESRKELTTDQINELSLLIQSEKNKIFNDDMGIATCAYTGGFYTVSSAAGSDNSAAATNAYGKIGSRYYVVGTGDFSGYTCSGLVATSWTEAGFNLGGKWNTPAGLESNSKTILQWLWTDV